DHQVGTTNPKSSAQQQPQSTDPVSGSIEYTVSYILTHKDKGLEEINDLQQNEEKQKTSGSTNPKVLSLSSPQAKKDPTTNVPGHDGHTDIKTSVKANVELTEAEKPNPTTVGAPSTVRSTEVSTEKVEPSTVITEKSESKEKGSTVNIPAEGKHSGSTAVPVDNSDNSSRIILEEVFEDEVNGTLSSAPGAGGAIPEKKEKYRLKNTVHNCIPDEVNGTLSSAPGAGGAIPEKKEKYRLKNTVHNCIPLGAADMLGFGDLDLSHAVALRIPIACMIISMLGVSASVFHAFTNLSRPRRCRSFVENVAQVILWTLCAITLFLIRQDWDTKWEFGTARSFSPLYPNAWHCAELLCYIVVVAYLVECYFYDYTYYKIYFEETLGNYTVVDRPEYGNSIYTSTVEMTEDTAL
ncbi:hypothetical protein COOONC_13116, partial [Cooperia oncophora]